MLPGEFQDFRYTGHGAVRIGQFAEHSIGFEAGHAHQVHGGFGVSFALQYSAGPGLEGKNMAGAVQIGRHGIVGDGRLDRAQAGSQNHTVTPRTGGSWQDPGSTRSRKVECCTFRGQ